LNPADMMNNLPNDLIAEIGELGLDSLTILRQVLVQFGHLFSVQKEAIKV
jgi:hypothetical protein